MAKYMLSKNGQEIGPYALDEVLGLITRREVELFDYIYDEQTKDWVLLTEHQDITRALKASKPKAPPQALLKNHSPEPSPSPRVLSPHEVEWYIMKGQSQFGPFASGELLRLMQEKSLFEFDFVWHSGMKDWQRLAEIPEFSKNHIQSLVADPKAQENFIKRQHVRIPFQGQVIVHDQNDFWKASGKEISEGGMGIYIKNAMIVPGQILHFHVPSLDGKEAFNIKGEIVSKQFVKSARHRQDQIEYGVRFLNHEHPYSSRKLG